MSRSPAGALPRLLIAIAAVALIAGACSNPTGPVPLQTMSNPAPTAPAATCAGAAVICNP